MQIFRCSFARSSIALALVVQWVPSQASAQNCAGDLDGNGIVNGADLGILLTNWGLCPASVTSVSPSHGSVLGGTVITITGGGLGETSMVTIGGAPCTGVTVLSPNSVRAVTPAGVAGEQAIRVTTPAGTTLSPQPFTYVQQSVASIQPNNGSYTGGTAITISGAFLAGTTGVMVGGVPATNVVNVDASTVTAVTPAGSVGTVDVVVTGTKGTVVVAGGFTYQPITVPSWATLVEAMPDPAVVTNAAMRAAITASRLAWRVRDTATQVELLLVPAGTFTMGCTASTTYSCYYDENPAHLVTLTQPFYMGRYELTQAQWAAKMGSNPSTFQGVSYPDAANRPVEMVSWTAVQGYLAATGMRLPTEAEWEYACRGGTTSAFSNGTSVDSTVSAIAWITSNSGSQTHVVGGKAANPLGMHDMGGNVQEWVNDWYLDTYYEVSPSTDPRGPASGTPRVLRGGSWGYFTNGVRSSYRLGNAPSTASGFIGFRVVRDP